MKLCTYCNTEKDRSAFHVRRKSADGLALICKDCKRIAEAAYRRTPTGQAAKRAQYEREKASGRSLERRRAWQATGRHLEGLRRTSATHRQRHPEKVTARSALNHAIRDGRLSRQPCEVCGGAAQAHHHDYSKPLEVRWLCRAHHAEEHRA